MFYRKIQEKIESYLKADDDRILIIDGARQIGKSFIIRYVCSNLFKNYIEINLKEDSIGPRIFDNVNSVEQFYIQLSLIAGEKLGNKDDTIVFLDEIQSYPKLLTLLKFLRLEGRFHYIVSGSLLGVTLAQTPSIPMGSITIEHMYQLDFEEFLLAMGVGKTVIAHLEDCFNKGLSLDENLHNRIMELFHYYLITGGLPDAVKAFVEEKNIFKVRKIQQEIHDFYAGDASQYDSEKKLSIRSVFDSIPSNLENRKKRVIIKEIENKKGTTFSQYSQEFDYLISSGIALAVKATSTPVFPLIQSSDKNLLKLYLNDCGLLTSILYGNNINAILNDAKSINLGSVYECVVASELKAHGFKLFYYDNRKKGEVDFLIDDYNSLSVLPIEVKSGKDYSIHASLDKFIENPDYSVKKALVLSNSREIKTINKTTYMPVYFVMFLKA